MADLTFFDILIALFIVAILALVGVTTYMFWYNCNLELYDTSNFTVTDKSTSTPIMVGKVTTYSTHTNYNVQVSNSQYGEHKIESSNTYHNCEIGDTVQLNIYTDTKSSKGELEMTREDIVKDIMVFTKEYRHKNKINLRSISETVGKAASSISRYESLQSTPSNKVIQSILKALNLTVIDIFDNIETDIDNLFEVCSLLGLKPSEQIKGRLRLMRTDVVNAQVDLAKCAVESLENILNTLDSKESINEHRESIKGKEVWRHI